jgi:hypothetical protein
MKVCVCVLASHCMKILGRLAQMELLHLSKCLAVSPVCVLILFNFLPRAYFMLGHSALMYAPKITRKCSELCPVAEYDFFT